MMQSSDATSAIPAIDCLIVTLPVPERFELVRQSIDDYCRQTYENKRLIIVFNRGTDVSRKAFVDYVTSLQREDIEVIIADDKLNLGALRNLSVEKATAEYVCQWDDDDRSHPERLKAQVECLRESGAEAVFLQDLMQYFPSAKSLYWVNWRATPAGGHPGTLMARRSDLLRYPTEGASSKLGEDLILAMDLKERGLVGYLPDMAHLFV